MFDLALYQFGDEATMSVRDPLSGEIVRGADGSPVTITLSGRDSRAHQEALRKVLDRRQSGDEEDPALADAEFLAKLTKSWTNIVHEGRAVPCEPAHVISVYKRFRWLREQANAFIADRRNFFVEPSAP